MKSVLYLTFATSASSLYYEPLPSIGECGSSANDPLHPALPPSKVEYDSCKDACDKHLRCTFFDHSSDDANNVSAAGRCNIYNRSDIDISNPAVSKARCWKKIGDKRMVFHVEGYDSANEEDNTTVCMYVNASGQGNKLVKMKKCNSEFASNDHQEVYEWAYKPVGANVTIDGVEWGTVYETGKSSGCLTSFGKSENGTMPLATDSSKECFIVTFDDGFFKVKSPKKDLFGCVGQPVSFGDEAQFRIVVGCDPRKTTCRGEFKGTTYQCYSDWKPYRIYSKTFQVLLGNSPTVNSGCLTYDSNSYLYLNMSSGCSTTWEWDQTSHSLCDARKTDYCVVCGDGDDVVGLAMSSSSTPAEVHDITGTSGYLKISECIDSSTSMYVLDSTSSDTERVYASKTCSSSAKSGYECSDDWTKGGERVGPRPTFVLSNLKGRFKYNDKKESSINFV